jgi:hypothetical protein
MNMRTAPMMATGAVNFHSRKFPQGKNHIARNENRIRGKGCEFGHCGSIDCGVIRGIDSGGMWTRLKVWLIVKLHLPVRSIRMPQSELDRAAELLRAASDKPNR